MKSASDNILAVSTNFIEVLEQASALAKLNKPVLVIGERGTGKELVANRLHYLSPRWQEAFVSLNCSGLNDNLLESELLAMKRDRLLAHKKDIKVVLNVRMEERYFSMN